MYYNLIKFNQKRNCRLWLKKLQRQEYCLSSLYQIDSQLYLLLGINKPLAKEMIVNNNYAIVVFNSADNRLTPAEQTLFNWAQAELENGITFISFEAKSSLSELGRELVIETIKITRTFAPLADLMAVINFTSDSFSDGGKYDQIDTACARIIEQVKLGAKIIDIGAESSTYHAVPLTPKDEIKRLNLLLKEVIKLKQQYGFLISIDTYHNETVEWLCAEDIDILNDISGNITLDLVKEFTTNKRQYIAMHSLVIPSSKDIVISLDENPVRVILQWMQNKQQQLLDANINIEQVVFDPGIGFGNKPAQAWFILQHLALFAQLDCEILLGHSRKFFFSHVSNRKPYERDLDTAVVAARLINQVDYIRLHDLTLLNQIFPTMQHLF